MKPGIRSLDKDRVVADLGGGGGASSKASRGTAAAPLGPWSVDANTSALFYFDEASGSIVDEVASLTLTASGTPTYSVAVVEAGFTNLTPGITTGVPDGFGGAAAAAAFDFDQDDFVIEFVCQTDDPGTARQLMAYALGADGWTTEKMQNNRNYNVYLKATDATVVSAIFTNAWPNDTNYHKARIAGDRSANLEMFVDGVSKGTASLATLSGKDIKGKASYVSVATLGWKGTWAQWKLTVGDATTNSGNE